MNTHEHYEELCALAASGQASRDDMAELRSHLENCSDCRDTAEDFGQVSAQGLATLVATRARCEIPSGMALRFMARARSEGIEMRGELPLADKKPKRSARVAAVGAIAAAVVVGSFLLLKKLPHSPLASDGPRAESVATSASSVHSLQPAEDHEAELRRKLASLQEEIASLRATSAAQRSALDALSSDRDSLSARLSDAEKDNVAVRAEIAEKEQRATQIEQQLEKSVSEKSAGDVALTLQEAELRDLRRKVAEQSEALAQQRELATRESEVRDLIVARKLHIIDVHDRDGEGKSQRAFGRIFFTEGKSLTFYAYDLTDPQKLDAKVSFHVWGARLGAERPIKSLGVFHNDDEKDGRWVLTFDDPSVLAQINSVFVTMEASKKTVREPKGPRILFAFLGGRPNHP